MKNKIKSLSFWLELSGILVLIIDSFAQLFEINLYSNQVADIITTICIILISFGVITKKDEKDLTFSSFFCGIFNRFGIQIYYQECCPMINLQFYLKKQTLASKWVPR